LSVTVAVLRRFISGIKSNPPKEDFGGLPSLHFAPAPLISRTESVANISDPQVPYFDEEDPTVIIHICLCSLDGEIAIFHFVSTNKEFKNPYSRGANAAE